MAKSSLLRSHDELRAALRLAGAEIRKLNFGKKDSPMLQTAAPAVAKAERGGEEA